MELENRNGAVAWLARIGLNTLRSTSVTVSANNSRGFVTLRGQSRAEMLDAMTALVEKLEQTTNDRPGKPLDQMIELWAGIVKLHFDEYSKPLGNPPVRSPGDVRRDDRLLAKAQMVLSALSHYKTELER